VASQQEDGSPSLSGLIAFRSGMDDGSSHVLHADPMMGHPCRLTKYDHVVEAVPSQNVPAGET